jgi:hypothetical protein
MADEEKHLTFVFRAGYGALQQTLTPGNIALNDSCRNQLT